MVLDVDPDDGDMSDLDVNGSEDPSDYDQQQTRKHRRRSHRLHIAPLLQMILQDAQTRLFFKAQAVVQSDIRHYVPKVTTEGGGDLGYPMKLLSGSGEIVLFFAFLSLIVCHLTGLLTPNGNGVGEKQSVSQLWSSFSGLSSSTSSKLWTWATMENRETWYPTLKRTVWVLEQLHEFVNVCQHLVFLCFLKPNPCSSQQYSKTLPKKPSSSVMVPLSLHQRCSLMLVLLVPLYPKGIQLGILFLVG